jgi:hypothetical protein
VDYQDASYSDEYASTGVGYIYRFDTATYFVPYEAVGYGTWHNRSPAAFLQDTWRLTERLAVNAGLRWSAQYLIGQSGRTAQQITDEWQPRAGLTIPVNIACLAYSDFTTILKYYSTDPRQPGAVPDSVRDVSRREEDLAGQLPGLQAENLDEFTLGYERLLGEGTTLTVRGIQRNLRSSFQWGFDAQNNLVLGTPGKDDFDFLPSPKREYNALEISAEGRWQRVKYRTSYVLSRSWGNFPGLYDSDNNIGNPGRVGLFSRPNQAENSTGFLPNDHPHVFKLTTAYTTQFGLVVGAFLTYESGSPVNELALDPAYSYAPSFLVQRGKAGRTTALWNLDVRFAYDLPTTQGLKTSLLLDLLHIGNPQRVMQVDELHYTSLDASGNPESPSPNYKQPMAYQPPMAVRLGLEMSF